MRAFVVVGVKADLFCGVSNDSLMKLNNQIC